MMLKVYMSWKSKLINFGQNVKGVKYRATAWFRECMIQESLEAGRVFWKSIAVLCSVLTLFFKHLLLELVR